MPSKRTSTYPGKLGARAPKEPKRLYTRRLRSKDDDPDFTPDGLAWAKEIWERFRLLFDHFGIDHADPDCWSDLAWALARKHVPGLRSQRGGAPRKKNTPEARSARRQLWDLIDSKREATNRGVEAICKDLEKKRPAELPDYYRKRTKLSPGLLKADYQLAKKELLGIADWPAIRGQRETTGA